MAPPIGRGRASPWPDGFTLQPASHRAALSRRRLRGDCDPPTRSRNCPGRPFRRRVGRLVGGNASGGPGSPRRIGRTLPLHMIGFSNGGALAMKYALDGLGDKTLSRPDRIILISPMIGITSLARFAGVFGWPAVFPGLCEGRVARHRAGVQSFKYNSFPVNAARQSSCWPRALQQQIAQLCSRGRLVELPPMLTFQSVVDFTVSTRAIINALYAQPPANGSELVLFDLNRNAKFGPLLRSSTDTILTACCRTPPRTFKTTIITNVTHRPTKRRARYCRRAQQRNRRERSGSPYPPGLFALASRVAFPSERFAIRYETRRNRRGFRRPSWRHRHTRRARYTHRQHRFAESHVVQPVLSILDGTHRGRHRRAQRKSRHQRGRYCAGYRSRQIVLQFVEGLVDFLEAQLPDGSHRLRAKRGVGHPGHRSGRRRCLDIRQPARHRTPGPSMDSRQASIGWMGCACPRFALGEVPVRSFPVTASC